MNKYPKVNFIGNKEKLTSWICDNFPSDAISIFDAFSGGASISYESKIRGLKVLSNDILLVNYHLSKSLIENNNIKLTDKDINIIFSGNPIDGFMFENYSNVYFHSSECKELDLYRQNVEKLDSEYKKSLALTLLRRSMIRKMPYSRFNLTWDKIKLLRDEEYSYSKYGRKRAYHNKPIKHHFIDNLEDYNNAVFDNGKIHKSYNEDIFNLLDSTTADIIYIDPPYAGTMNNYFGFYSVIDNYITSNKTEPFDNNFTNKKTIIELFDNLFSKLNNFKYWYISYNSGSVPTKDELVTLLNKYSDDVKVIERQHNYQVTGKKNKEGNKEYLFIAKNRLL